MRLFDAAQAGRVIAIADQASRLMGALDVGLPAARGAPSGFGGIAGMQGNVFMTMASDDGAFDFSFSVGTAVYHTLTRDAQYRWASQERIGRSPAKQFLGVGEQTISLPCTVLTQMSGGAMQAEALRAMAAYGRPVSLTDLFGYWHGFWVITKVGEVSTLFMSDGTPQKQDIHVELAWYGADFEDGVSAVSVEA